MRNYNFTEEFIAKFNEKIKEEVENRVKQSGELVLPFENTESLGAFVWDNERYKNDPEYAAEMDALEKREGYEESGHTHFDMEIDGRNYHGKLWQIRDIYTDTEENAEKRDYAAQIWLDESNETKEGYYNIPLNDEMKQLLDSLYRSYIIFVGEDREENYDLEEVKNARKSILSGKEDLLAGLEVARKEKEEQVRSLENNKTQNKDV